MWQKATEHITPQMWHNSVRHCDNLIRDDRKKLMGNVSIEGIPPIIIQLGESDEPESDSDDD
jgi:hypothetical protein